MSNLAFLIIILLHIPKIILKNNVIAKTLNLVHAILIAKIIKVVLWARTCQTGLEVALVMTHV